jgi:hypothetical protein
MPRTCIGIGWYRKEQWDYLRSISSDRDVLETTWEEWEELAETRMIELMKAGHEVQKVTVDVAEFDLWCRTKNRPCDGAARSEYIVTHLDSTP